MTRLLCNKSIFISRGNHSRDNYIITMQLALAKLFIGHLLFQASFYNYFPHHIEPIIKERTNNHNIFKGIIRHSILIFFLNCIVHHLIRLTLSLIHPTSKILPISLCMVFLILLIFFLLW